MKVIFPLAILLLLIAACKKDTAKSNQAGQLVFTLNNVQHTYNVISQFDSISTYVTGGLQQHNMQFGGIADNTAVDIGLVQLLNMPGATGFNTGPYQSYNYDTACLYNGGHAGCYTFNFAYTDGTLELEPAFDDSTGVLKLTSFSTTTKLMSGTFSCKLIDNNSGLTYYITNGKFTDIPFYFP